MRPIFKIVVCLPILVATALYAETVQEKKFVIPNGETVIIAKAEKLNVQVRIVTHRVDIGKPSDEIPKVIRSNCTYSRYPCSIVDGIDITVSGKNLFVPRSVFSDLADLNTAKVSIEQDKSILTLTGGDASESYIVKIEFDKDRIKRRNLATPDSPNEPLQVTIYYRRILKD